MLSNDVSPSVCSFTVLGEDFSVPSVFEVTFAASHPAPINGTTECVAITITDDDVLEGNDQDFTVNISSVQYPSGPSDNLGCTTDCTASVTLMDDAADCEWLQQ